MDALTIIKVLGGRWHGSYGTARCPAHDDKNPSLSVSERDGVTLAKCHAGCSQEAVIDALRGRGLWPEATPAAHLSRRANATPRSLTSARGDNSDDARRVECALAIWRAAEPAAGTLVETYLHARGITIPVPPSIRFAPHLKYTPSGVLLPAMVAAVQGPDRKVTGVHRTYLDPRGGRKAAVSTNKMALGPLGSGAVRLAAAGETLGLAEGIETGLSAMQLFDVPVWCALGSRLHQVAISPAAKTIILFADNGSAGHEAAEKASDVFTAQGRTVTLRYPPDGCGDWNDYLQARNR